MAVLFYSSSQSQRERERKVEGWCKRMEHRRGDGQTRHGGDGVGGDDAAAARRPCRRRHESPVVDVPASAAASPSKDDFRPFLFCLALTPLDFTVTPSKREMKMTTMKKTKTTTARSTPRGRRHLPIVQDGHCRHRLRPRRPQKQNPVSLGSPVIL